ncbi:MAG: TonB-dependent receptor plug domain-containing protein, partial [Myxococcota bacterium]|nr:TonB-dependent receptor plug domain-containing protein [Myxococcota bacterium]
MFFYTVLASCVCASSAHAKDEVHGRDQVVVTPETDEETGPNALTTLDLEDDRYQGQDLAAILATQPGLRITRIGGQYSSAYASIRGSTPEQVLVYLDGIPLNAATGGAVDLA